MWALFSEKGGVVALLISSIITLLIVQAVYLHYKKEADKKK